MSAWLRAGLSSAWICALCACGGADAPPAGPTAHLGSPGDASPPLDRSDSTADGEGGVPGDGDGDAGASPVGGDSGSTGGRPDAGPGDAGPRADQTDSGTAPGDAGPRADQTDSETALGDAAGGAADAETHSDPDTSVPPAGEVACPVATPAVDLGEIPLADWRSLDAPPCAGIDHFAVAAAGQDLTLALRGLPAGTRAEVATLRGVPIAAADLPPGDARLDFTAPDSGELRIRLVRTAPTVAHRYGARLECRGGCDREATRYPIVLIHGAGGTDDYFDLLDYFFGVRDPLETRGYVVAVPALAPIGTSEQRAEQLAAFLRDFLGTTGVAKVHLFGHSQGGIDARVLVGGLGFGPRVASITTLGAPHRGIRLAVAEVIGLVGVHFDEAYMLEEFPARYPDAPQMPRFSWAGATCLLLDGPCRAQYDGEAISLLLAPTYGLVRLRHGGDASGGMNDGLVPVESARWGEFLGVLPADHLDQIGQVAGLRQGPFDPPAFYLEEARRLRRLEIDRGL